VVPPLIVKFPVTVSCEVPSRVMFLHWVPMVRSPVNKGQLGADEGIKTFTELTGTE
jgi:predicted DNA-binding protein (UPF0278 family)